MDRVTLVEKGMSFETRFAAPSVLTGYFVAAVLDSDRETIEEAFTNPGNILVEDSNDLVPPKVYEDYKTIVEIREQEDEIIVIVGKEESAIIADEGEEEE